MRIGHTGDKNRITFMSVFTWSTSRFALYVFSDCVITNSMQSSAVLPSLNRTHFIECDYIKFGSKNVCFACFVISCKHDLTIFLTLEAWVFPQQVPGPLKNDTVQITERLVLMVLDYSFAQIFRWLITS